MKHIYIFILAVLFMCNLNAQEKSAYGIQAAKGQENLITTLTLEAPSELPKELLEFTNLERLILLNSSVKVIPRWASQIESLTTLELASSSVFPTGLYNFKYLEKVRVLAPKFSKLPDDLNYVSSIKHLEWANPQGFANSVKDLSVFKSVTTLSLMMIKNIEIFENISGFENLEHLESKRLIVSSMPKMPPTLISWSSDGLESSQDMVFDSSWHNLKELTLKYTSVNCVDISALSSACSVQILNNYFQEGCELELKKEYPSISWK